MLLITSVLPHMDLKGSCITNVALCRYKCSKIEVFQLGVSVRKINQLRIPEVRQYSCAGFRKSLAASPSIKMVSNEYVGKDLYQNKIYRKLDSCLVVPPPKGKKLHAIIKFLGGAFIGAVPEVTYSHLIHLLAKEGFLIISVPYNVTFDHSQAAREVYERFNSCLNLVLTSGLPDANISAEDLVDLPLYSVGHSNGALLQLLTGSYFSEQIPKANAIISFNNRPATEAVPYFDQLGPLVRQAAPIMEASPIYSMARSASGDAWKTLMDTAGMMIQEIDQEAVLSLSKFADQLPSVMNQVTQGTLEFKPTPSENRDCFRNSYNVPHTLLVKFNFDAIDETDIVEEILKPRVKAIGGTLEKITLNGNHLTPCIQDVKWQVGDAYTPADALAQGLKVVTLNDTRVLARTVGNWFKSLGHNR